MAFHLSSDAVAIIGFVALFAMMLLTHRGNIARLMRRAERKF